MKSRMMKLISLICCASVLGFGGQLTFMLWQSTAHLDDSLFWARLFLVVGLLFVSCGVVFCTIQAWRLFSIINLEITYRYKTLNVLNWLKRGTLVMTAGLLVDWWPVYLIADQTRTPIMVLIVVIVTILVGSIAVLAAMFQDVLITSHRLSNEE